MIEQNYPVLEDMSMSVPNEGFAKTMIEGMGSQTILCVDDEVNILQSLKRLLRKEGYAILTANSGEEGLEVLKQNPQVQVVISDQRMPGMRGSEFLLRVKNEHPDMLRVILSGYAEASAIVEAINEGEVYHFLTKPWNEDELKATIKQCLAHYHLKIENKLLIKKIQEQNTELQHLNTQLASQVNLQAQSLQFSQEILDKLPVPIIGIGQDGLIALSNEFTRNSLMKDLLIGESIVGLLPEHIADVVQAVLDGTSTSALVEKQWIPGQQGTHAYIAPIGAVGQTRGCIVLLMEKMS